MKDEISKILKMVEEGKINAEEGTELIDLLKEKENDGTLKTVNYSKKSVRIKVFEEDKVKVNITVPIKLIQVLLNIGKGIASMVPDGENYLKEVDLNIISEAIEQQVEGPIVDIETDEGERVLITIE